MRQHVAAPSVTAMTAHVLLANIDQGAPMIGALLAIAVAGALAYLVSGRGGSRRDQASEQRPEASPRSADE